MRYLNFIIFLFLIIIFCSCSENPIVENKYPQSYLIIFTDNLNSAEAILTITGNVKKYHPEVEVLYYNAKPFDVLDRKSVV